MKKIKIMLTAVTVLAVVGGALAFKAQKFSGTFVYQMKDATCPFLAQYTENPNGAELQDVYTTNINPGTPTVSTTLCDQTFKGIRE
jgi:hypothetical protein